MGNARKPENVSQKLYEKIQMSPKNFSKIQPNNSRENVFDFPRVLPENINNDNTNISKFKDPHKDFSIFGQFITNNQSEMKYKSFSPSHINDKSLKKSRSSRVPDFDGLENEEDNYFDRESRKSKKKMSYKSKSKNNDTFQNASISVLTVTPNVDFTLKSFTSNRPTFFMKQPELFMNV